MLEVPTFYSRWWSEEHTVVKRGDVISFKYGANRAHFQSVISLRRYFAIRREVLTEYTDPLNLTVWPGCVVVGLFFLNVACMPATAKASLLQLSSSVVFSPVGSSSLCLLNLTRHHWQSGTQPHMSLDGVWLRHLSEHILLPFVCSCKICLGGRA